MEKIFISLRESSATITSQQFSPLVHNTQVMRSSYDTAHYSTYYDNVFEVLTIWILFCFFFVILFVQCFGYLNCKIVMYRIQNSIIWQHMCDCVLCMQLYNVMSTQWRRGQFLIWFGLRVLRKIKKMIYCLNSVWTCLI